MTLTSKSLAALILPILFGGIFFSGVMGWWQTESTKEAAAFTEGEFAGQANPADIRGSYTFGDVERNFGVSSTTLAQAFSVQIIDPSAFQLKSLEELYAESTEEIGTASVRLFVAFYLGLPIDLSTDIYLFESAAALLRERSLTDEQAAYVAAHTIPNPDVSSGTKTLELSPQTTPSQIVSPNSSAESPTGDSSEQVVKGKTSFAELLEWGVSKEAIEEVLGMPLPDAPGMTVRDFCSANSLSFETIKPALQAEVDRAK